MKNHNLNVSADKTYFIIICTERRCSILTRFFPTLIITLSITPSDILHNLGVTFNFRKHISLKCSRCFYYIGELRRIGRYISLSVAKLFATALIISRLDYCNSLLYNIASKDILNFRMFRTI